MVLNFSNIPFPFGQGIDTKSNPLYVPIGKLEELENGVFTQTGAISKRNGYERFSNQILSQNNLISSAIGSATYNTTDLLLLDGSNIYSWFAGYNKWVDRGDCTIVNSAFRYVDSAFKKQISPDLAILNGLELFAWTDSETEEVKYSIVDLQTQAKLATDLPVSTQNTASESPRCFTFGAFLCIAFATDDGRVQVAYISPSNPTIPYIYTVASNVADQVYELLVTYNADAVDADGYAADPYNLIVSYKKDDDDTIITSLYDTAFVKLITYESAGYGLIDNLTVFPAGGLYYIAVVSVFPAVSTTDHVVTTFSLGNISDLNQFSTPSANYIIDTFSVSSVNTTDYFYNITAIEDDDQIIHFYYDEPSKDDAPQITHNILSENFTPGQPEIFKYYANLYSKAFIYNGKIYLVGISEKLVVDNTFGEFWTDSDVQPTYFLFDEDSNVKAKLHAGVAVKRKTTLLANIYPSPGNENVQFNLINDDSDDLLNDQLDNIVINSFQMSRDITSNYVKFGTSQITNLINEQVTEATLTFNDSFTTTELNNSLYFSGGLLQEYDGARVVEQGFNIFPESAWGSIDGSGNIQPGTYSYQFTYEWVDIQGKIEISAPSPAVQVVVTTASQTRWHIPNLTITNKSNIRVGIYRTQAAASGDPLLYKVGNSNILDSTLGLSIVVFTDNVSDTSLRSKEVLYCSPDTSGQLIQLENIAAPTCSIIASYKNRVFLAGTENPNQIWYSKSVVPGEPINFNEVLTFNLDPKGGPITALGSLNNNLIIFKQNAIYTIAGQGATNTGAQNDLTDPQLVSSDCGCINPQSIVITSQGLFFQSTKGIYLLNTAGTPVYVGAPVQAYNDLTISSASQIPDTNQIRFTTSDGDTLVYDYFYDQWATFSNKDCVSGGIWNDKFYFVAPNGRVYLETINEFLDHKSPVELKITTGWLSFAGIQNYQRVNSFLFLGDYFGHHILDISIASDGNPNFTQTTELDTEDYINPHTYGEQNVYGDNSPYGGSFYIEQARVFINNPRTQRIKVRIQERNTEGNKGLNLVSMNFKIGVKNGLGKVSARQQF